jgi:hypothetical protein
MTMSCERCDDWLQQLLDGEEPPGEAHDHFAACPGCRELYESALGLRQSLRLIEPPVVPAGMSVRIVEAILADRRKRRFLSRTFRRAASLAAAILLVFLVADHHPRPGTRSPGRPVEVVEAKKIEPLPTFRETVVWSKARVADAVDGARRLVPDLEAPTIPPMDPGAPLEPTTQPLRDARQAMASGLEPVAGSAKRAFALFVRDLNPTPGRID